MHDRDAKESQENIYINREEWDRLNRDNSPRVKRAMELASKHQADANVEALLRWKEKLGPVQWRELYVIVPTVWAVGRTNPRLELFRGLLGDNSID